MIINKLTPQGYCKGVYEALNIVYKASADDTVKKPIYILGKIINNKYVTNELKKLNIITIDAPNKTRLELLDEISSGTVIFSAHGVSNLVRDKAISKGLNIIDASCKNVIKVQNTILEHIKLGYEIVYIGTKNHPECEGILGLNKDIHFVEKIDDLLTLNLTGKIYVSNQTTLSYYDIEEFFSKILEIYPDAKIDNHICDATTLRQKAVINQPLADLCIVVGDIFSSNSKKLAYMSEKYSNIRTILIETKNDLDNFDFTSINTINITSGASTPKELTEEIINYIKEKNNSNI